MNIACPGSTYSRNSIREMTTDEANRLRALFGFAPITKFENNPRYFNADATLQWSPTRGGNRSARSEIHRRADGPE